MGIIQHPVLTSRFKQQSALVSDLNQDWSPIHNKFNFSLSQEPNPQVTALQVKGSTHDFNARGWQRWRNVDLRVASSSVKLKLPPTKKRKKNWIELPTENNRSSRALLSTDQSTTEQTPAAERSVHLRSRNVDTKAARMYQLRRSVLQQKQYFEMYPKSDLLIYTNCKSMLLVLKLMELLELELRWKSTSVFTTSHHIININWQPDLKLF